MIKPIMYSIFTLDLLLTSASATSWRDTLLADTARYRARAQTRRFLPQGWSRLSQCVRDGSKRLLSERMNVIDLTIESCIQSCDSKGYKFAGVEYGQECWCSSSLNKANSPVGQNVGSGECREPCHGNHNEACGGNWAITVYQKGGSGGSPTKPSSTTSSSQSGTPKPGTSSKYKLVDEHSGSNFFDGWTFFTHSDPTQGHVEYLSQSEAKSKGLAYVDSNGLAVMKVDSTNTLSPGADRDSVRIGSTKQYSQGLMLFDITRMPWGCSVWPALWTVGPSWPQSGEIDIIEGINNSTTNQMTLHT